MRLSGIFHTLRYRNFRLFFAGQGISLIGTWMQHVAMGWLVYRITNSPFLLGVVGFSSQIPAFFSPVAGVFADRLNRRRLLLMTQIFSMLQAFLLATLTLSGVVRVWHIIILSAFLGFINALDIPVRQSFIVEMVERKENLSNAIALNSLIFNSARLIGPSVAGVLVAMTGEGICFLLNGLSFVAVIISLLMMKMKPPKEHLATADVLDGLKEGLRYSFGSLPIRSILFLLSVLSLMGMSYTILMPVFARDILHGGPQTLGLLMASAGAGALFATIYMASRKSVLGFGRMMPLSVMVFAAAIMLFSISRSLSFSLVLMAVAGFGLVVHNAAGNTILQTIVDDDKRGRVMSLYTMAFMGMAPLGSLGAGTLAGIIGASNTLILGGAVCIVAAAIFARRLPEIRKVVHPVYKRIGIIPEVASGVNIVAELVVPPED
ncbi:MAG: MFS transporter [Candidatus Omnitrophica bacterium]|nr:MFS transporter [Candidatus Omnitrophota bacterium]MCM8791477.1 MFS transporter [Candidatus Omnitrophota bacterium]